MRGISGEIYNIGGHNKNRNSDVIRLILKEFGAPENRIAFAEDRMGHDLRYALDSSKAQRELGWTPESPFEDGLKQTVSWYLENRTW